MSRRVVLDGILGGVFGGGKSFRSGRNNLLRCMCRNLCLQRCSPDDVMVRGDFAARSRNPKRKAVGGFVGR